MASPHSMSMTGPSSLRPTGFAETILTFTVLLCVVCVIAVGLRTWERIRDRNFHIDDGLTWLGLIFNLFNYGVVAWGTTVGIGSPDSMLTLPMMKKAAQVTYWLNVTYLLAMGFTKASICSTLLRINKGTAQRKTTWALWLIMIAIITSTLGGFLTFVIRCNRNGGCKDSNRTISILNWFGVGVYILVDIALAVVPIFIIRGLNMKKSLRLSTGAILAMGGVACLAAILRIPSQLEAVGGNGANQLYKIGSFILWSEVETGLGIIACCLPMLRKLLRSFDKDRASVTPGKPVYYKAGSSGNSGQTPINNIHRLPYDSYLVPDQEKGFNTLTSFSSEGTSLPLQHTYSSSTYVPPRSGGRVQHEWPAPSSSSRGLVEASRDVDQACLYAPVT